MPSNTAAFTPRKHAPRLELRSAPYTPPREGEIVIRNRAIAINPIDWIIPEKGDIAFPWLKYPFILGSDTAGEVVEVGSGVTRFKVGDRVLGHAIGTDKKRNSAAEGSFQTYTVLMTNLVSPIPSTLSFEDACVIPLGLSTAACGLFQDDQLALQSPSTPRPKSIGKTLIVWGGSTSVGSNAIQLACAAGYEVFTTASPKNFEYCKNLGASQVFDYSSKTVVADMIRAFNGKVSAGAISIGHGSADACFDILNKCNGTKFISMASFPAPQTEPTRLVLLTTAYTYLSGLLSFWIKSKTRGIRYKFIWGSSLAFDRVGKAMYEDFLPKALQDGEYIPAPEALVVGRGLESIQAGCAAQKKGVSARKIVISM